VGNGHSAEGPVRQTELARERLLPTQGQGYLGKYMNFAPCTSQPPCLSTEGNPLHMPFMPTASHSWTCTHCVRSAIMQAMLTAMSMICPRQHGVLEPKHDVFEIPSMSSGGSDSTTTPESTAGWLLIADVPGMMAVDIKFEWVEDSIVFLSREISSALQFFFRSRRGLCPP